MAHDTLSRMAPPAPVDAEAWPLRVSTTRDAETTVRAVVSQLCTTLRRPEGAGAAAVACDPIAWRVVCESLAPRAADLELSRPLRLLTLDAAELASRGDYAGALRCLSQSHSTGAL
jgi:hypothetical protein